MTYRQQTTHANYCCHCPIFFDRDNPDELQIDLTNDDDEDDTGDQQVNSSGLGTSSPSVDQGKNTTSITRGPGTTSCEKNLTPIPLRECEEEQIRATRPFIVISPLTTASIEEGRIALGSPETRGAVFLSEPPKTSGPTSSDKNRPETTRTNVSAPTNKTANYRHLLDTLGEVASGSRGVGNVNTGRRESSLQNQDQNTSDGSSRNGKRRHTSDRRDRSNSPWRTIRPVSSYLQSTGRSMEDCVPGVDLFDYSDGTFYLKFSVNDYCAFTLFPSVCFTFHQTPNLR